MNRPRGRPPRGAGLDHERILQEALALLDEGGGHGLSMRALAARLGVSPMSLYRHVGDRDALLRAVAERVYAGVLAADDEKMAALARVRALLLRYHQAVSRHPQLALALFATPGALDSVTGRITARLDTLLAALADPPALWRDILVDHAHGSGLAIGAHGAAQQAGLHTQYQQALERLLASLAV